MTKKVNEFQLKELAKRVKLMRVETGLTQNKLAEKAGITTSTLSFLENGLKVPQATTLIKVAKACGREPFELLDVLDLG